MEDHSNDGLRTLVIGSKRLEIASYDAWSAKYRRAMLNLAEIEKKSRDEDNEIDRLCDEMERGLTLLGTTALEDKLQDGVPSTIYDLGRGGISTWMLTGDKEETAINIGFACQLIDTATQLYVINKATYPTQVELRKMLADKAAELASKGTRGVKHAIVVDGEALETIMETDAAGQPVGCQLPFLSFSQFCGSIICCRCAPSQKAQVVTLVKLNVKGAVTLAIGDGANDVAMIQAADVGVGISGQEGMQAANSADYSFAQFRFLRDLLLVQGRNNYRRMATLVPYVLYKNILMVMTTFCFYFHNCLLEACPEFAFLPSLKILCYILTVITNASIANSFSAKAFQI
jgi:magnesium-transporting ATPase (P-type)